MEIRQIEYVVAVVDHGSFSRAAQILGVAQPSLSQGVRTLERELGVSLFQRTTRGVVLSSAGSAFLEPARQVLRDLATLGSAVDAVRGLGAGRLDLVCLPTLAVYPMVDLVGSFRKAHPAISVRLIEPETAGELTRIVRSGRCELGLTDIDAGPTGGLVVDELEHQRMVAVRPPGTPAAGEPMTLSALAGVPLVATPPGTSSRDLITRAFEDVGIEPIIAVETGQSEAVIPLVLAGAGTTFLPAPLADVYRARGVVVVELDPPLTRTIGIVRRSGPLSPAGEAFLAMTKEHFVSA